MDGKSEELVLVDTCVFLRYFFAEDGKDIAGLLLGMIVSKELKAVVSVCTLSELVTVCIRSKKEDLIPTILLFIRQYFYVANTTPETAILAGYFKAQYSRKQKTLSYVDSVILATSFLYGSILLSYDSEYDDVKEVGIKTPDDYLREFAGR
ncbi:MAG: PIN domain-containing protein [Candidatus Altiarchaeia archaeon]